MDNGGSSGGSNIGEFLKLIFTCLVIELIFHK